MFICLEEWTDGWTNGLDQRMERDMSWQDNRYNSISTILGRAGEKTDVKGEMFSYLPEISG